MSSITTLLNELLISIFLASPTAHDALRLSGTNRLFRAIFLDHETLIVECILRPQIPAFDDAAALAIAETTFLDIKGPTSLSPDGPLLPLRCCIPRLLRNAELASSACAESAANPYPSNYFGDGQEFLPPVPATYYFIRQMVLAYNLHHRRDALYARLRTAPTEWINHQNQLVSFLVCDSDAVASPAELFTADRWEFAAELITAAHQDRRQPNGNWLEKSIREYTIYT